MKNHLALTVIDMWRGFLEQGFPLFCGDGARPIIPIICRLIERKLPEGTSLFFAADTHAPNDGEFAIFPPHCVRSGLEAQIIPDLSPYLDDAIPIDTTRYSAFFNTDLHQQLQHIGAIRLIVCGLCTDICARHTVADARYRDCAVKVRKDCVASFEEAAHASGLRHMQTVRGTDHRRAGSMRKTTQLSPSETILSGQIADFYFLHTHRILESESTNPR